MGKESETCIFSAVLPTLVARPPPMAKSDPLHRTCVSPVSSGSTNIAGDRKTYVPTPWAWAWAAPNASIAYDMAITSTARSLRITILLESTESLLLPRHTADPYGRLNVVPVRVTPRRTTDFAVLTARRRWL